jgi:hypothetical protein
MVTKHPSDNSHSHEKKFYRGGERSGLGPTRSIRHLKYYSLYFLISSGEKS